MTAYGPSVADPTVSVTAVGRAACVPDQVVVGLGVEVVSETVGQALRAASDAVRRLLALLDDAGIDSQDRQTSGLSVDPHWDPATSRQYGHNATYRLRVVVADLEAAGRLVEAAAGTVGDPLRVSGFHLEVADPSPQQEQARRAAVAACRRQAEQLADAAGTTLGPLVNLEEGTRPDHDAHFVHLSARPGMRAAGVPVEGGVLEVAVVVSARWLLLP